MLPKGAVPFGSILGSWGLDSLKEFSLFVLCHYVQKFRPVPICAL